MIRMTVWRESGQRAVYEFDQDEILVGRAPPADVLLDDETVSRRHSRLTRKDGKWQVADLGAANGVFIQRGGTPPAARVIVDDLASGDVLCIERFRLLFEDVEGKLTHKGGLVEGKEPELDRADGITDVRRLSKEDRAALQAAAASRQAQPAQVIEAVAALSAGLPVSPLTRELPAGQGMKSRHLEVFEEGSSTPRKLALGVAPIQFGSDPTCDVKLSGLTVPRFVAVIESIENRLMVRRVSSGILGPKLLVNGQAVRQSELTNGAKLFIGHVTAVVRLPLP